MYSWIVNDFFFNICCEWYDMFGEMCFIKFETCIHCGKRYITNSIFHPSLPYEHIYKWKIE